MKKILLLFIMCALLPKTAGAQGIPTDNTFTVSDLTLVSDNLYTFDVSLSGSRIYSGYNLSITIPSGMAFARNAKNKLRVAMIKTDGMYPEEDDEYTHTLSSEEPTTNTINVACISLESEDLEKTSGELFRVHVTIDNAVLSASFSPKPIVKLSGLNLTTKAAVKYVPADFACRPFTTGIPTSRTLSVNVSAANKIGTLILPFNASRPSGLKAYTCNAIDGDLLKLTPAASIEACTPYIVYAENGYSGNLTGTAELTDGTNVTDIFADGYLTGVLTATTVNTGYILQNQGEGPMFYDAEGVTFSLPAGRCYLTPPASGVKAFAFNFGDAVGIAEQLSDCKLSNCQMFDLSGRKVSSPTRGIYIQGTRKVVVK